MIRVGADRWVRPADLRTAVPGREDSNDLLEACVSYLESREGTQFTDQRLGAGLAQRSQAELAAAYVLKIATLRVQPEDVLSKRLTQAEKTIDRLLAFVPTRALAISDTRISELIRELIAFTRTDPFNRVVAAIVEPETETDTEACHRITLTLAVSHEVPAEQVARRTFELHRVFAERTSPDERRAVRLIIESEFEPASGPDRQS